MGINTIIIKASDYQYPTGEELLEVYKTTPDLHNFEFISEHPLTSLISDERSISEIYRIITYTIGMPYYPLVP